jgi:hypothetical protein
MKNLLSIEEEDAAYEKLFPLRWKIGEDTESTNLFDNLTKVAAINQFVYDFTERTKRFFIVHAGRRSFKSELSKRMMVDFALKNGDKTCIYAGPTISQTGKIAWEDLKKMVPKFFVNKILEMDQEIRLVNGSKIRIAGLDVPERIEGAKLDFIAIDEFGDIKDNVFRMNILPALADTKGMAILCGTPNGCKGEFWEIYSNYVSQSDKLPDYGLYHWSTADVRGWDFIEPYRSQMTKLQFEQEWLGKFVQGSGKAYLYDRFKHLNENIHFKHNLPIDISADFNVAIMPWIVAQSTSDMTAVIDEVVGRQCSIEHMSNLVKNRVISYFNGDIYAAKSHSIRWYGDATASYVRDPSAHQASWSIIKDNFREWNVEFKVTRMNPRIGDRIELTNSRLLTADQQVHCQVNPKVKELILDFESISHEDIRDGNKTKSGNERSHASDAFGYYCWHLYKTNYRKSNVEGIPI